MEKETGFEINTPLTEGTETALESAGEKTSPDRKIIVQIMAAAIGVVGVVMLICGMVLHRLDEKSREIPEMARMPQEYIDEFFSADDEIPDIENFIEPEG